MIQYVVLEDGAYCSATRYIVGFVDFGIAEIANLTAANNSMVINVLAVFMREIVLNHREISYFMVQMWHRVKFFYFLNS